MSPPTSTLSSILWCRPLSNTSTPTPSAASEILRLSTIAPQTGSPKGWAIAMGRGSSPWKTSTSTTNACAAQLMSSLKFSPRRDCSRLEKTHQLSGGSPMSGPPGSSRPKTFAIRFSHLTLASQKSRTTTFRPKSITFRLSLTTLISRSK